MPLLTASQFLNSFGFIECLGTSLRGGTTALTKSEDNGVDDENSHHEVAESVVQDKPLDASPPGAIGAAARCHNGPDLVGRASWVKDRFVDFFQHECNVDRQSYLLSRPSE